MTEEQPIAPPEGDNVENNTIQYMKGLKKRLSALRKKHDEIVNQSIEVIKEINGINTSLVASQIGTDKNVKKLIQEFQQEETVKSGKKEVAIDEGLQLKNVLDKVEKLIQSNKLEESLALLNNAKESFGRIDDVFNKIESKSESKPESKSENKPENKPEIKSESKPERKPERKSESKSESSDTIARAPNELGEVHSVRHKINLFNRIVQENSPLSAYGSCASSLLSVDKCKSTEDVRFNKAASISVENGYEGDNDDSEYDITDNKRK